MRRSTCLRHSVNGGLTDKKSTTKTKATKSATVKLSKLRSSNKLIIDSHHINNNNNNVNSRNSNHHIHNNIAYSKNKMPVYNIIARRHKVCTRKLISRILFVRKA